MNEHEGVEQSGQLAVCSIVVGTVRALIRPAHEADVVVKEAERRIQCRVVIG